MDNTRRCPARLEGGSPRLRTGGAVGHGMRPSDVQWVDFSGATHPVASPSHRSTFSDKFRCISNLAFTAFTAASKTYYLVRRFSIAGTPKECIERIEALCNAGVEHLMLTPARKVYDETVEAFARKVIPHFN